MESNSSHPPACPLVLEAPSCQEFLRFARIPELEEAQLPNDLPVGFRVHVASCDRNETLAAWGEVGLPEKSQQPRQRGWWL